MNQDNSPSDGRVAKERLKPFRLHVELRGIAGTERVKLESHGRGRTIGPRG